MDPLLREQIEGLRDSPNKTERAQATILEVVIEVRDQGKRNDARLTTLEADRTEHNARLLLLEGPHRAVKTVWQATLSTSAAAVVIMSLWFGFLATKPGEDWYYNQVKTANSYATATRGDDEDQRTAQNTEKKKQ